MIFLNDYFLPFKKDAEHKVCGAFCLVHSPNYRQRMADARKKGGHGKSRAARMEKPMPSHLRPVYNLLAQARVQVHQGDLSLQQASAMSSVAGAMVRVLTTGELEKRVRSLGEQTATGQTGITRWVCGAGSTGWKSSGAPRAALSAGAGSAGAACFIFVAEDEPPPASCRYCVHQTLRFTLKQSEQAFQQKEDRP
jgi:hypothetical protein